MAMVSPAPASLRSLVAAVAASAAFVIFTVWYVVDGGMRLDAALLRFTGWLMRGWADDLIGASWRLGEPQLGFVVVAVIAVTLAASRRYRASILVAGGFLLLSALQIAVLLAIAGIRHFSVTAGAIPHLYPSGHTGRVPFIGVALAAISGRRLRLPILAATTILAIAVAMDRTDSGIESGSAVTGGLLMGLAAALWFAALHRTRGVESHSVTNSMAESMEFDDGSSKSGPLA